MKKNIILLPVLAIVLTLLYGCDPSLFQPTGNSYGKPTSFAEQKPRELTEQEINEKIAQLGREFSTLGFKGLHLSMTHQQVNDLVKDTPWGYDIRPYGKQNDPQFADHAFLKGDFRGKYGATWANIGCEGPRGEGSCYWIRQVQIKYHEGKVVEIVLRSPSYSANKIDAWVKDWGIFALKGLKKKYGKPTKVYKTFSQVNILSFKSGYDVTLHKWRKGKEQIRLTIGEDEYKYSCAIKFQDAGGLEEIKQQKSKFKSAF